MANLKATFLALNCICSVLNIAPFAWHVKGKNIPAMALILDFELMTIKGIVDECFWGGANYMTTWDGHIWCDIMVHVEIGCYICCFTSVFCILLDLLIIFMVNKVTMYWFCHPRFRMAIQLAFVIVFPAIIMGVSHLAFSRRYAIYQISGCKAVMTNDRISLAVYFFWLYFWGLLDVVLSAVTVVIFIRRKGNAREILTCTNSGLSIRRFLRLLLFCIFIIALLVFTCIYVGFFQLRSMSDEFQPDPERKKLAWNAILRYPHSSCNDTKQWVYIACSIFGFCAFGTGKDAREMYTDTIRKLPYGVQLTDKVYSWQHGDVDSESPFGHPYQDDLSPTVGTSQLSSTLNGTFKDRVKEWNDTDVEMRSDPLSNYSFSSSTATPVQKDQTDRLWMDELSRDGTHVTTTTSDTGKETGQGEDNGDSAANGTGKTVDSAEQI